MQILNSIKELVPNYNLFILDIFGVIHDGVELYPNVIETLEYLAKQDKRIVFLSNAPRRSERAIKTLEKFGIHENMYDFILTSGEHAFYHFEVQNKLKYYYLGPEKDRKLLAGTPHEEVAKASDADIAIVTGLTPEQVVDDVMPQIEEIKAANLTIHCINPDLYVHKKNGRSHICAGAIAKTYIEMGGKVEYYGKPFQGVYEEIIDEFEFSKKEILCVGDALETDVKGGNNIGLDTVLVTSGIHRKELDLEIGTKPNEKALKEICDRYNSTPNFAISLLGA